MASITIDFDDGTEAYAFVSEETADKVSALLEIFGIKLNIKT